HARHCCRDAGSHVNIAAGMPNEYIGTCGRARLPDREAISVELEFGIACLRHRYGTEPAGSWLEVLWHDHDSGSYPTISLVWGEHFTRRAGWAISARHSAESRLTYATMLRQVLH